MPRVLNKLTDPKVKNARGKDRPYKLSDGGGMFLLVNPNNSRYWRLKYRISRKEKLLALGVYPEISLAEARRRRGEARKLIEQRIDPSQARKEDRRQALVRSTSSFETVAREWHKQQESHWTPKHAAHVIKSLEADIFPKLGNRSITEITPAELLDELRVIEERGALEIAARVLQRCSAVFRYGIATSRLKTNPASDLKGALKPSPKKHYPALEAKDIPEFLERLEVFDGNKQTQLAIRLLMLTFVRTGELIAAHWSEFDIEGCMWRIPAERMKLGVEHLVPLSEQTTTVLNELKEISGTNSLILPGRSNPRIPISNNTILFGIYRMGYRHRMTGHGFRTIASTVLNEMGFESDAIERQLAHGERDKVRAAYNRAKYLGERKRIMQAWSDYLKGKNNAPIKS